MTTVTFSEFSVSIKHIAADRILRQCAHAVLFGLLIEFDVEQKLQLIQPEHQEHEHQDNNDGQSSSPLRRPECFVVDHSD